MKSKRSQWGLLLVGIGAMALSSGCVIRATTDDADGGATSTGSGTTASTSTGSATGSTSVTGSTSTTATGSTGGAGGGSGSTSGGGGGSSGGTGGSGGGSGGSGGAWMDSGVKDASGDAWQDGGGIDSCDQCLVMQCSKELEACFNDPLCFSGDSQDPGQYERVIACVEQKRTMQAVKRADLVNCGLVAVPGFGWPPDDMADTTTNLINCMATGQTMVPMNNSWANSQNISQPWAPNSCAKLACTSMVQ